MSKFSEQLRLIADFFEQHPELPTPLVPDIIIYAQSKDDALKAARLPGARKSYDDTTLWINVSLSDAVVLKFFTYRQTVCTAKRVEKVLQPAQAERWFEKVVEWDCHPLLKPDDVDSEAQATELGSESPLA